MPRILLVRTDRKSSWTYRWVHKDRKTTYCLHLSCSMWGALQPLTLNPCTTIFITAPEGTRASTETVRDHNDGRLRKQSGAALTL